MEKSNTVDVNNKIYEVCDKYHDEKPSGRTYIHQTGLNKVAKLLGGDYKSLTKKQRTIFRDDCCCVYDPLPCAGVKSWFYYTNLK